MILETDILSKLKHLILYELEHKVQEADITSDVSLFEDGLGLDSVNLVALITLIEEKFAIEFADEDLRPEIFNSLKNLSQIIIEKQQTTQENASINIYTSKLQPVNHSKPQLLSIMQYNSWVFQVNHPDSCANNIPIILEISGALNVATLKASLNYLIKHQAILCTYYQQGQSEPEQLIDTSYIFHLEQVQWLHLSEEHIETALEEAIAIYSGEYPFDLTKAPPWRAQLIQINTEKSYLLLVMHHILIDYFSAGILLDELANIYQAIDKQQIPSLKPLTLQYIDYAVWQRKTLTPDYLKEKKAYWEKLLKDLSPPLSFIKTTSPSTTGMAALLSKEYDNIQTDNLHNLAKQLNIQPFIILLAIYILVLYPYTDKKTLLIKSPLNNQRTDTDLEKIIGFFSIRGIFRFNLSEHKNILGLLQHINQVFLSSFLKQTINYPQVQYMLGIESIQDISEKYQPIINFTPPEWPLNQKICTDNVCFHIDHSPKPSIAVAPLVLIIRYIQIESIYKLQLYWQYRTDIVEQNIVEQLSQQFTKILIQLPHQLTETIEDIL